MKAKLIKHRLNFKTPSGTSRGVLAHKDSWFLILNHENKIGIGECSIIEGLSPDAVNMIETQLEIICNNLHLGFSVLYEKSKYFPAIQFCLEMAFRSLNSSDPFHLFPSDFVDNQSRIAINGLVWMGSFDFMKEQIRAKIASGFDCIKLKIGAIDFEQECLLLSKIRKDFSADTIEIRVDANGAFSTVDALQKLDRLSKYDIHSIEQPIQTGQWEKMSSLCFHSPIPIALDEELIGHYDNKERKRMLSIIQPKFVILKPSLLGGWRAAEDWIHIAESLGIHWWATSALESNIGLNAIAQWVFMKNSPLKQGLGTGQLFTNNIESPLEIQHGYLSYTNQSWKFKL